MEFLYHGSDQVITEIDILKASHNNDFGKAFYTTLDYRQAMLWACQRFTEPKINIYSLDHSIFNTLNVKEFQLDVQEDLLQLIATLAEHRNLSTNNVFTSTEVLDKFKSKYYKDVTQYDVIISDRIDDSTYQILRSFFNEEVPIEILPEAIRLGNLGTQICFMNNKSLKAIRFASCIKTIESPSTYSSEFKDNKNIANEGWKELRRRYRSKTEGHYIDDFINDESISAPDFF